MKQPDYGSFIEYFDIDGQSVFFSIHREMYPGQKGIAPTGRYFVYCLHPIRGSCQFILQRDEHNVWRCEHHPPYIDQDFIARLGKRIEAQNL